MVRTDDGAFPRGRVLEALEFAMHQMALGEIGKKQPAPLGKSASHSGDIQLAVGVFFSQ